MHRTHNKHFHFFLISHLPAYLKRRSLVAPPHAPPTDPPSLNEKAITTVSLPPVPAAWRRSFVRWEERKNPTKKPNTPAASPPAFSSASASPSDSPLFPRTSSPLHRGCRLSLPLSLFLHPLCSLPRFAPPISELWAALGLDGSLSQWLINTGIDPLAKCL